MKVASKDRARYSATFLDHITRRITLYPTKNKCGVFYRLHEFLATAERQEGSKLQYLQSNGGGQYLNEKFTPFLKSRGIVQRQTCAYAPRQNRVAESMNQIVLNTAKAILN